MKEGKVESNGQGAIRAPRAVLDAGGEASVPLSLAIRRRVRELASGQILEVISLEPEARADIVAWCRATGNVLLHMTQEGHETRFWIEKA